ncbi:MAG: NYN domain-containing protein [Kiritimatiellae bacterium]|nr:NYN domain-containing protein [Kiritimatiellia bacterium]
MPQAEDNLTSLAVLIDADNVSPAHAGFIFSTARKLGDPIVRRAYGMVDCFSREKGWWNAQREFGIVARPQVSNVSGKNVADIALAIDAMELLYKKSSEAICLVSSDSDFTAVAAKIREEGCAVYGIGGEKTPISFRQACTQFFVLPGVRKSEPKPQVIRSETCPRCGGKLVAAHTKSRHNCRTCPSCGGLSIKLAALKSTFSEESLSALLACAQRHEQIGCICPDCGTPMSLARVAVGKKTIEIDICAKCRSVWYDKDEFNSLVPTDGLLQANVSAGKAYRREIVIAIAADLRSGHAKVADLGGMKTLLKRGYFVPTPDIQSVISSLMSQKVLHIDKAGKVTIIKS